MADSPLVLLSGHAPRDEIGRGSFQEMDQVAAARPMTKAAWLVERPERAGDDVREALAIARAGRPGPVHLSLPGDVLDARVEAGPSAAAASRDTTALDPACVREIIARLNEAQRPLILVGPSLSRGERASAVGALGIATGIPVLSIESPRGVNDPWLRGASRCFAEADVVLLLGKRLDFSLKFGGAPFSPRCRFFQVALDAADPLLAIGTLLDAAHAATWRRSSWRADVERARTSIPDEWDAIRRTSGTPMHPLAVAAALAPHVEAGAVLVSDGGEFGQWMQAGLEPRERLINSIGGSIGSAIPMAVAAKLARPDRTVIATLGDGTFGFHPFELDTAVRYGLPIVCIVGNDARWNAEHQLQLRHYGADRTVGCDLAPTRCDRVAEALGGYGEHVDDPAALPAAIERAIASRRPAVIDVTIASVAAPVWR